MVPAGFVRKLKHWIIYDTQFLSDTVNGVRRSHNKEGVSIMVDFLTIINAMSNTINGTSNIVITVVITITITTTAVLENKLLKIQFS